MLLSFANKSQIKKLFKFNYRSKNMFEARTHPLLQVHKTEQLYYFKCSPSART